METGGPDWRRGICFAVRLMICAFDRPARLALGMALLWALPTPAPLRAASPSHYVFAHYMVCMATYGDSVDSFKLEIQQAQAAGIDGFLLDLGEWDNSTNWYYKSRTAMLYSAAEQLGTGFKLCPFVEFPEPDQIINLVTNYAGSPASLWYQGRVVLSSWGMNNAGWNQPIVDWTNAVLAPLQQLGYPVCFVPFFWPYSGAPMPGTYADPVQLLATNGGFLGGLFWVGAAGTPSQLATGNSNYTAALHAAGKLFMASVTPHYWGSLQTVNGRRYFETDGGEGIALQWASIIANQPDWVDLVTWNDFYESTYTSPVENPSQYFPGPTSPVCYSHKGYLALSKYFINWFKSGSQPAVTQDALYYFYRTHPQNAVASNTNDTPVTTFFGDIQDVIYTTLILTADAQLVIASGGNLTTNSVPAGLHNLRSPFAPGPQRFTLLRNGQQVLSTQGPNIQSQIVAYDFFPASGFAYSPATNSPPPPANLHVP